MPPKFETKRSVGSPDKRQEPFSLLGTLDKYEVEELNAREFARLINKQRRRETRLVPPGGA